THSGCKPFVLAAASPGSWGNGIVIEAVWGDERITALIATEGDRPPQRIELDPESGQPSTPRRTGEKTLLGVPESVLPELMPNVLVNASDDDPTLEKTSLGPERRQAQMTDGADGVAMLRAEHFSGDADGKLGWGIDALARVDGVSFVAVPDLFS